jgi:hypothetical protein
MKKLTRVLTTYAVVQKYTYVTTLLKWREQVHLIRNGKLRDSKF